jgi:hypothetical protein
VENAAAPPPEVEPANGAEPPSGAEASSVAGKPARTLPPSTLRALDLFLQAAGLIVAIALAVVVAIYGAFLTPYRVGTTLVPVSLLIGVAGNIGTIWLAYHVTGRKFLSLLPGAVWIILTFLASTKTHEGDLLLISSDWVASAYLLAGPVGIAVAAYVFLRPRHSPG